MNILTLYNQTAENFRKSNNLASSKNIMEKINYNWGEVFNRRL